VKQKQQYRTPLVDGEVTAPIPQKDVGYVAAIDN
jgi:hypothetical protein